MSVRVKILSWRQTSKLAVAESAGGGDGKNHECVQEGFTSEVSKCQVRRDQTCYVESLNITVGPLETRAGSPVIRICNRVLEAMWKEKVLMLEVGSLRRALEVR